MNFQIISSLFVLLAAGACNGGHSNEATVSDMAPSAAVQMSEAAGRKAAPAEPGQSADLSLLPSERKIIRNGEIRFETSDNGKTLREVKAITGNLNGWISNENVFNTGDRTEYMLTIRIPASQFDALLEQIGNTAGKVESKNISSTDVTEEFIDVEARIRTKKELESRYRELLDRAEKVDELLNIERELGNLRAEIESLEGRLNFLKSQVSYSTLQVVFYQRTQTPFGFAMRLGQALHQGWNNLLGFTIGLIRLWPFLIIIPAIWITIRKWRRRKKNKSEQN